MMTRIVKQCLLILLALMVTVPVLAQDNAKAYEVIGNKPVNARSCPHVSCPVVQSIQPGETVMVVDTEEGDAVLGSNQWYKVDVDGKTMYVHSSLVKVSSANDVGTSSTVNKIDMSDWTKYKGTGYSFSAPSDWVDMYSLMEDKDYREALAEMRRVKPSEIKADWEARKQNGLVAELTVGSSITLDLEKFSMKDWPNKPTLQFLKPAFKAGHKEAGATVNTAEIVTLPLGDCLHIHAEQTKYAQGTPKGTQIIQYVTLTVDYMYVLTFYTTEKAFAKTDPIADAVAQSLTFIRGNANA